MPEREIKYRVLICGDRNWDNPPDDMEDPNEREGFKRDRAQVIADFMELVNDNTLIIEGGARGADKVSSIIAGEMGFPVCEVMARWDMYGKAAGPIRNREMFKKRPDLVVGFHENIFQSKGTKDMISVARHDGTPYLVIGPDYNIYQYGNIKEEWMEKLEASKFKLKGQ